MDGANENSWKFRNFRISILNKDKSVANLFLCFCWHPNYAFAELPQFTYAASNFLEHCNKYTHLHCRFYILHSYKKSIKIMHKNAKQGTCMFNLKIYAKKGKNAFLISKNGKNEKKESTFVCFYIPCLFLHCLCPCVSKFMQKKFSNSKIMAHFPILY